MTMAMAAAPTTVTTSALFHVRRSPSATGERIGSIRRFNAGMVFLGFYRRGTEDAEDIEQS
jgi:hypothetical protein